MPPPGFRNCTPPLAIQLLRIALLQLHLPGPAVNPLLAKVDAALASVAKGNNNAACGQLGAFVNQVRAQSGKMLTAAQSKQLTNAAQTARAIMGCK